MVKGSAEVGLDFGVDGFVFFDLLFGDLTNLLLPLEEVEVDDVAVVEDGIGECL